ncbi:hypothetical protein EVA_19626 [gut metagenome]|uniref:Uncharacterized protein n=1 Tax=gut metagenome TaxID=749906 RepID=J9FRQ6_9ZZZZ
MVCSSSILQIRAFLEVFFLIVVLLVDVCRNRVGLGKNYKLESGQKRLFSFKKY